MNLNNNLNKSNKDVEYFCMNFPSYLTKTKGKFNPEKIALLIVFIHALVGASWVFLSDKFLGNFIADKSVLTKMSIGKGLLYVFLTSLFLFFLIFSTLKRMQSSEKQLIKSYDDLSSAHEKLMSLYEELSSTEEELRHNLYHDFLTNLPNKLILKDELYKLDTEYTDNKSALFFIDLDNFKYINDNFGHTFGDKLIIEISNRLSSLLNEKNQLFRFGGDEFIFLAKGIESINDINNLAHTILHTVKLPMEIDNNSIVTTLSIGISVYPNNGINGDELLKKADIAMYKAKGEGKNKFIIYDEPMSENLKNRINIENHLRNALNNDEFILYYQPQYNTVTGKASSFEALLRWKNADLGFVSPNDFITIAEDTNLIIPLGKWVLKNACTFIKNLNDEFNKSFVVSVNISMLQLLQNDFVDTVNEVLTLTGLNPELLELEITESILMQSFSSITDKLEVLKKNGIKIALDDFGKGYSSFNYLKQLPITTLKIDKCFIDNISIDTKSSYIVGSIVSLGRKVGLNVVAEGVETSDQLHRLIKYKCDKIQGYYFSKPMPESEVKSLMAS